MQVYADLVPVEGRRRRLGWVPVRTIYLDKAISEVCRGGTPSKPPAAKHCEQPSTACTDSVSHLPSAAALLI